MNPLLFEAYKKTSYCFSSPIGEVKIRIDQANPLLNQLLLINMAKSWVFITAWNPYSLQQEMKMNISLNNKLEEYLAKNKYAYFKGFGVGDDGTWPPEASFLVLNIPEEDAINLGRQLKQNAIVWGVSGKIPKLIECLNNAN